MDGRRGGMDVLRVPISTYIRILDLREPGEDPADTIGRLIGPSITKISPDELSLIHRSRLSWSA